MTFRPKSRATILLCVGTTFACGGSGHQPPADPSTTTEVVPSSEETSTDAVVSVDEDETQAAPADETSQFRATWTRFVDDWNSGNAQRLEAWNASSGVFLLDNPGAFIRVRHFPNIAAVFELEGGYDGARIKTRRLTPEITDGPVPKASCEKEPAVPSGVFAGPSEGRVIADRVENLAEYDLASEEEVAKLRGPAEQVGKNTRFVVYDASQSVKFYFGGDQGRQLLAIDATIPCSA